MWRLRNADCEACRDLYRGHPPCHECNKTDDLHETNILPLQIWLDCSRHGRHPAEVPTVGALSLLAVSELCEIRGGTQEDFERVLALEDAVHPIMQTNASRAYREAVTRGRD